MGGFRPDVRPSCSPRRSDLPARAVAGVVCTVGSSQSDSVGIYLFRSSDDMFTTYFERLADNGVQRDTGDCARGDPGEHARYPPELEDEGSRIGCFVNAQGFANVRWTFPYEAMYLGVLGNTDRIDDVLDWMNPSGVQRTDQPPESDVWQDPGTVIY